EEDSPEIVVCLDIIRFERHRSLVGRKRVLRTLRRSKRNAEIIMRGRRARFDRHGTTKQFHRLAGPAELVRECTEAMQRVRMPGCRAQQRAVYLLRLPQQAAAVERNRDRMRLRKAQYLTGGVRHGAYFTGAVQVCEYTIDVEDFCGQLDI